MSIEEGWRTMPLLQKRNDPQQAVGLDVASPLDGVTTIRKAVVIGEHEHERIYRPGALLSDKMSAMTFTSS